MRYIVQQSTGHYVQRLVSEGGTKSIYWPSTPDYRDAYDFKTKGAAKAWMTAQNIQGKIHTLTDEGYWPED